MACGIPHRSDELVRAKIIRWWLTKPINKVHQLLLQCLPSIICWETWKYRCSFKYEGIRTPDNRVIDQISNMLYLILHSQFPYLPLSPNIVNIFHLIEHIKPTLVFKLVKWMRPTLNECKLNVDGCSKGNPGSAGGGGVLRDHDGHMLMAFSAYFGCCSNNYAEAQALKIGLSWCLDHGFSKVNIESDSLLIIQMVKGEINPYWQIKDDIGQIQAMSATGHFTFTHIFREGNTMADMLANFAEHSKMTTFFTEVTNLPPKIISTLKNDKVGKPNIRIRVKKGNFIFDPG